MTEKFNSPSLAALFYDLWELFGFRLIVDCGVIEMRVRVFKFKQIYYTAASLNAVKEFCVFNSGQKVSVNKCEDVFILN